MGFCATWYMHIQRHHLAMKLQLHLGHVGEKKPRACFCGCAVLWRRCLNTLVFVSRVKKNWARSVLVCKRFLALLSVLHLLPPSGRFVSCWRAKDTFHWGILYRLKSIMPVPQRIAFSYSFFFFPPGLLWLGECLIIINSFWKCAFQVIFTDLVDVILAHTALYFHKLHTTVSNEYDNLTNSRRINIPIIEIIFI